MFKPQNCLVAFRLPVLLLRKADFLAAQSDMTRSQLFRRSIVEFVEQYKSGKPIISALI
jgi:predicted transcriptional regulator